MESPGVWMDGGAANTDSRSFVLRSPKILVITTQFTKEMKPNSVCPYLPGCTSHFPPLIPHVVYPFFLFVIFLHSRLVLYPSCLLRNLTTYIRFYLKQSWLRKLLSQTHPYLLKYTYRNVNISSPFPLKCPWGLYSNNLMPWENRKLLCSKSGFTIKLHSKQPLIRQKTFNKTSFSFLMFVSHLFPKILPIVRM